MWIANSKDHVDGDAATITTYAIGLRSRVPGVTLHPAFQKSQSSKKAHPSAEATPVRRIHDGRGRGERKLCWMGQYAYRLLPSRFQDMESKLERPWRTRHRDDRRFGVGNQGLGELGPAYSQGCPRAGAPEPPICAGIICNKENINAIR
jgi:hypothetical protein